MARLTATTTDQWGHRFVYEGPVMSTHGPTPDIRSVWEMKRDEAAARLLTAYPI